MEILKIKGVGFKKIKGRKAIVCKICVLSPAEQFPEMLLDQSETHLQLLALIQNWSKRGSYFTTKELVNYAQQCGYHNVGLNYNLIKGSKWVREIEVEIDNEGKIVEILQMDSDLDRSFNIALNESIKGKQIINTKKL